jgi:hypothetical protein
MIFQIYFSRDEDKLAEFRQTFCENREKDLENACEEFMEEDFTAEYNNEIDVNANSFKTFDYDGKGMFWWVCQPTAEPMEPLDCCSSPLLETERGEEWTNISCENCGFLLEMLWNREFYPSEGVDLYEEKMEIVYKIGQKVLCSPQYSILVENAQTFLCEQIEELDKINL